MPEPSLWFIRIALIHFVTGITCGMLLLMNKSVLLDYRVWSLLPMHIELLLAGWILNLVMGVAYWILPRYQDGPARGNEKIVWLAFVLLNSGIMAVVWGKAFFDGSNLTFFGRLLECLSVPLFASQIWRRLYRIKDLPS